MTSTQTRPTPTTAVSPPPDRDTIAQILEQHAENPSAFLALNGATQHFTVADVDGVIAYQLAGRSTIVQFGGVFADSADQPLLLGAFLDYAHVVKRRIVAVQLLRPDAELYATHGFTVNQFGADYARALDGFSLAGKKHMQLRNKISRARRAGVTVVEVTSTMPDALDDIDRKWLRAKGRHVKELKLMVGERGGPAQAHRRLFVAQEGTDGSSAALAYISFSPVHGARSGWLHDLSRRRPDAPPGVLELIVSTAIDAFRAEGAGYLHFGFTPFTSLSLEHEVAGASRVTARLLRLLAAHGTAIYPAADQLAYKQKWGLDIVEPEYLAFQGGISLRSVWNLLRITDAV